MEEHKTLRMCSKRVQKNCEQELIKKEMVKSQKKKKKEKRGHSRNIKFSSERNKLEGNVLDIGRFILQLAFIFYFFYPKKISNFKYIWLGIVLGCVYSQPFPIVRKYLINDHIIPESDKEVAKFIEPSVLLSSCTLWCKSS